ncbi:MAG: hypothetical protein IJ444_02195 [Kiritimatiellae bacterium]|nr:hypothetical protein [Kiritimatiellia bacterium]
MANNIVNNYSSSIVTMFKEVVKTYEMNLDIIKQTEEELNDLYHECELAGPKDMYKGYLLYVAIREARIRRRTAKEENEMLKDMYDFFQSQQGQAFKSRIQSIQGASVKIRATQEARTYTPRQRNDLTCTDKHSTANRPFEDLLADFNKTKVTVKGGKLRK